MLIAARIRLLVAATILVVGCSDDGTGPDPGSPTSGPRVAHGFFLDDAVAGLGVEAGEASRVMTDVDGAFAFTVDEPVSFFVGDLLLGTVATPRTRITPNDFGTAGVNLARFVQSLDTTPGVPGIDLTGLDLAATPIDFAQGAGTFGTDPAVVAALAVAEAAGGSGVLVTPSQASAALAACVNARFDDADFEDTVLLAVSPDEDDPCLARLLADGTGDLLCADEIESDPDAAPRTFTWTVADVDLDLTFTEGTTAVRHVNAQPLGLTGPNRFATQTVDECLTCDADTEVATEAGVATLILPLALDAPDVAGRTLILTDSDGLPRMTVSLVGDGTGSVDDGDGTEPIVWAVDEGLRDVLTLRGTGEAGAELRLDLLFLIRGTLTPGTVALRAARVVDQNGNGLADDADLAAAGTFGGVETLSVSTVVR